LIVNEPSLEQSSYSDLVEKYYLDTNLSCDVNIVKYIFNNTSFVFQQKFVSKQDDFSKAGNYALNALHKVIIVFRMNSS
jgi:hypothetical protein